MPSAYVLAHREVWLAQVMWRRYSKREMASVLLPGSPRFEMARPAWVGVKPAVKSPIEHRDHREPSRLHSGRQIPVEVCVSRMNRRRYPARPICVSVGAPNDVIVP